MKQRGAMWTFIVLGVVLYSGAVLYGDIMFITTMERTFPNDGLLRAGAMAGAIMVGVSAIALLGAKIWWFAPGAQTIWGWVFWAADIFALVMNTLLAHTPDPSGLMASWAQVSAATPIMVVVGWGVAIALDPRVKMRHTVIEAEARAIEETGKALEAYTQSDEFKAEVWDRARVQAMQIASNVLPGHTPKHRQPSLPMPAPANPPQQVAPTAPTHKLGFDLIEEPVLNGHGHPVKND